MLRALSLAIVLFGAVPALASSETAWDEIRHSVFPEQALRPGDAYIQIAAPYRTDNDVRTIIGAEVTAPEGARIAKLTLVLDENPMPVSAVLTFEDPQPAFAFETTMRVNGPTPVHLVAEMTDGTAYVVDTYVKTSGTGACSAPPGTDPLAALESLGQMQLTIANSQDGLTMTQALQQLGTEGDKELVVDISHPSHSGMQKDQISLLFIPMRYVSDVEVGVNGAPYVDVAGSISLSEDPSLKMSVPGDAQTATVTMTDTDGTVTEATASVRLY